MQKHIFKRIESGSIAARLGLRVGDALEAVNGKAIEDIFDYRYLINDTRLVLSIIKADGSRQELSFDKDEYEDLGIEFETGLMSKPKGCANRCIFCFIDQLPAGMRESLYFKDDDPRLSFLHGNYVTLTNLSNREIDRLAYYHLSPINISVHTTDPSLRVFMLNNPKAANLNYQLEKLISANIEMNFQVVLCKDINDGVNLDKTIGDLGNLPRAHSLSIVPAGLTDHRISLHRINKFSKEDARALINQVIKWQSRFLQKSGTRFVYAADEFYLMAELDLPSYDSYEDFPQLENGVGMLASFYDEFRNALKKSKAPEQIARKIAIATGVAAYPLIKRLADDFKRKFHITGADTIQVIEIENNFFGKDITVSGLLTGADIIRGASGIECDSLLIPASALRADDTVFLDDIDVRELGRRLNIAVKPVRDTGHDMINAIIKGIRAVRLLQDE